MFEKHAVFSYYFVFRVLSFSVLWAFAIIHRVHMTCFFIFMCRLGLMTKFFKIFSPRRSVEESSWMGYLTNYLPTQVTDVFTQGRAFATAHLPFFGVKNFIAINT